MDANTILVMINLPYKDSVITPTSLSKNHMSVGPVISTIPTPRMNIVENLGTRTAIIFSRPSSLALNSDGYSMKQMYPRPPIHAADTKPCIKSSIIGAIWPVAAPCPIRLDVHSKPMVSVSMTTYHLLFIRRSMANHAAKRTPTIIMRATQVNSVSPENEPKRMVYTTNIIMVDANTAISDMPITSMNLLWCVLSIRFNWSDIGLLSWVLQTSAVPIIAPSSMV